MMFSRVNIGIFELITSAAMCSHGTPSRVSTPHVHLPKYDPRLGSFTIVTVPPSLVCEFIFRRTVQMYPNSSSLTAIVKSKEEMLENTSSYSTLPRGVSSVSVAQAKLRCLTNHLHSILNNKIHAFNGSTAVFALISLLAAFIDSIAADDVR